MADDRPVPFLPLIVWDRRAGLPEMPGGGSAPVRGDRLRCLACCGYIAGQRRLSHHLGLPADITPPWLVEELFRRWGTAGLERLDGPLAGVLWEARRRRLVVWRDRLGQQGVYYRSTGDLLLVAGEVAPLLAGDRSGTVGGRGQRPSLEPEINPRAVLTHLHGMAPPAGESFYRGIHRLEAGQLLIASPERVELRTYWRPEPTPALRLPDDAAFAELWRERLLAVVADHAPERGGAAITLSGGMDSTSVAAALRHALPDASLTAFEWISPELPVADQEALSSEVARHLALERQPIRADLLWPLHDPEEPRVTRESPLANVYDAHWQETFRRLAAGGSGSSSGTAPALLFTGLSGDHLLGGNAFSYPDLLLTGRWRSLAWQLAQQRPRSGLSWWPLLRMTLLTPLIASMGRRPPVPPPVAWLAPAQRAPWSELAASEAAALRPDRPMLPGRCRRLILLRDRLLPWLAEASTRLAATHRVELRHPLIDHRLFELAAATPADQAYRAGVQKGVLRRAMTGLLPATVVSSETKVYPNAIAHRGLRERERDRVWALLDDMRAAQLGLVDQAALRAAYRAYLDGGQNAGYFWYALTLEAWLRRCWP